MKSAAFRGKRRAGGAARVCQVAAVVVVAGVVAGCGAAAGPGARRGGSATVTRGWRMATMTITPAGGLSAGERVRVSVRGFPPWAKVFLSECARAGDVGPLGCGQQLAGQPFLIADGRGAASGSFAIQPAAAAGPLHAPWAKCAAGPGCVLVATIGIPVGIAKVVATAELRFAPAPTQPATPASLPAGAPLTVLRRVTLPGQVWLLAAGAGTLFAVTGNGPGTAITRVSPATGRAGPSADVSGAIALAFGGGMLWVVRQAQAPRAWLLPALALDPATLAMRHSVALPDEPGWGGQDVAYADGLIWVAGTRELMAIDPVRARLIATVPLGTTANTGGFISVAAPPSGTALWTTEGTSGGGPIGVQRRDPRTGAVLDSAGGPVSGIGAARIAAAPAHAWLAYATGISSVATSAPIYQRPALRAGLLRPSHPVVRVHARSSPTAYAST